MCSMGLPFRRLMERKEIFLECENENLDQHLHPFQKIQIPRTSRYAQELRMGLAPWKETQARRQLGLRDSAANL